MVANNDASLYQDDGKQDMSIYKIIISLVVFVGMAAMLILIYIVYKKVKEQEAQLRVQRQQRDEEMGSPPAQESPEQKRAIIESILTVTKFGQAGGGTAEKNEDGDGSSWTEAPADEESCPSPTGESDESSADRPPEHTDAAASTGDDATTVPAPNKSSPLEDDPDKMTQSCDICLADYENGDEICSSSSCVHVFHKSCLVDWLVQAKRQTCPTCRAPYLSDSRLTVSHKQNTPRVLVVAITS